MTSVWRASTSELRKPIHPILEELDPLERRQAESPVDQGEIDSIGRLDRKRVRCRLWGTGRRLGWLGHGDHHYNSRAHCP